MARVIIAGSRSITDYEQVATAVRASRFEITEVVSGCAGGPDTLGEIWAANNGVGLSRFPARWRTRDGEYNPRAGFQRNQQMAEYADALIAVWDGESGGTRHMIEQARKRGLKVYIHTVTL